MNKKQLIAHFGSLSECARFMGVSRAAITQLPNELSETYQQSVIGRMLRNDLTIPKQWLKAS
jgi:predicted transcriptional regulator